MKTTILSIAAAAAITLASAGAAMAAPSAGNAGLFEGASSAKVQLVRHRHRGFRRHRGHGYGRGFAQRPRCRRLYYRGYVQGDPFARRLFNRFCTYRFGYRHGGYRGY